MENIIYQLLILFTLILFTFLCVMAIKIVTSEGMLLESVGKWGERKLKQGHKWVDLVICQWCASTLQAFTAHAFAFGLGILPFEWDNSLLVRYFLVVFGGSVISGNVWNYYLKSNAIKENNEEQTKYFKNLNSQHGTESGTDTDEEK